MAGASRRGSYHPRISFPSIALSVAMAIVSLCNHERRYGSICFFIEFINHGKELLEGGVDVGV